jgi:hypothetical protein
MTTFEDTTAVAQLVGKVLISSVCLSDNGRTPARPITHDVGAIQSASSPARRVPASTCVALSFELTDFFLEQPGQVTLRG